MGACCATPADELSTSGDEVRTMSPQQRRFSTELAPGGAAAAAAGGGEAGKRERLSAAEPPLLADAAQQQLEPQTPMMARPRVLPRGHRALVRLAHDLHPSRIVATNVGVIVAVQQLPTQY
jgi:hypothetical protein